MERMGHDQKLFVLTVVISLCVGMIVGGLALWRLFPNQIQQAADPLKRLVSGGTVAGASVETEDKPTLTFQAPTLVPSVVPALVTVERAQFLTAAPTPQPTKATSPTPAPSPTIAPYIGLQNGDFSEGTRFWERRGQVTALELPAAERREQFEGIEHFIRLASETNLEWLGAHGVQQTFRAPTDHKALEFWYRINTLETEPGFDSPCLVVLVNEQAVAWFSAADASDDWQRFAVPLPADTSQPISVRFSVGQTGDQVKASWVDLTNLYTQPELPHYQITAPLSAEAQLRLSFTHDATIGLHLESPLDLSQQHFTQKLHTELLLPEIGLQQVLAPLPWNPDGASFQPVITSPDFFGQLSGFYAPDPDNPWNLPVQLNQLNDHNLLLPVKLWLVVKTALEEVLQLVRTEY